MGGVSVNIGDRLDERDAEWNAVLLEAGKRESEARVNLYCSLAMNCGPEEARRLEREHAQALREVEAAWQGRTRIVGSFDNMDFDHDTPLVFAVAPAVDDTEPEPTEREDDAWIIWDRER